MACSATIEGKRVIGQFTTDAEWAAIKKLSKQRMVFMPDTGLPAVAKTIRRSGLVTRFFSHFPGEVPEGYTSNESPEHMALKLAVYAALLRDGYKVELEAGRDDWRADVLLYESARGPLTAIEIQLTAQSAERTHERTAQRNSSGAAALWLFNKTGATNRLGTDLLSQNPAFEVKDESSAVEAVLAVAKGAAFFDDLSSFALTPARPVAVMVNCWCDTKLLWPLGTVLLPNEIRGDQNPLFVSWFNTSARKEGKSLSYSQAQRYFDRYTLPHSNAAKRYELVLAEAEMPIKARTAQTGKHVYTREVYCPVCGRGIGSSITGKILTGIELTACPVPTNALVDARPVLRLQPKWFVTKIVGRSTPVMQKAEWQARFSDPLKAAIFGVPPKEGSYRYWAWHKVATEKGIIP